jgi:hypothetical protein
MKKRALKILTLFMSLNILFSAMGFALFEHTCHSIGHTTFGFSEQDFCDMAVEETEISTFELSFKQGSCCETEGNFQNLSLESGSSFNTLVLPVLILDLIADTHFFNWQSVAYFDEAIPIPDTLAPPNNGRQILIKIQTFLI